MDHSISPALQAQIDASDFICGSDECGLGSWAGPLSVCAAVAPRGWTWPGVTDSKKLTAAARERVYPDLVGRLTHCLIQIDPEEFDAKGAGPVLIEAHARAITGAVKAHQEKGHRDTPFCIVDGIRPVMWATPLPKADLLIPAVSAASIIAKVSHDRIMKDLDRVWPGYGFSKNAGYGTPAHRAALDQIGVSKAHRRSYSPMSGMVSCGSDIFAMLCGLE